MCMHIPTLCLTLYIIDWHSEPVLPNISMIIMIHLSSGASPSGMLQPGGYQIPPPHHQYSGSGGYQPTFAPSQLQRGMALSCTAVLLLMVTYLCISYLYLTVCQYMYLVANACWSA